MHKYFFNTRPLVSMSLTYRKSRSLFFFVLLADRFLDIMRVTAACCLSGLVSFFRMQKRTKRKTKKLQFAYPCHPPFVFAKNLVLLCSSKGDLSNPKSQKIAIKYGTTWEASVGTSNSRTSKNSAATRARKTSANKIA